MYKQIFECRAGDASEKNLVIYCLGKLGRDWMLTISGGESHIGALACSDKADETFFFHTLSQHLETDLVNEAFRALSGLVSGELLVVGGIHYDAITKLQIKRIIEYNATLIEQTKQFLLTYPS